MTVVLPSMVWERRKWLLQAEIEEQVKQANTEDRNGTRYRACGMRNYGRSEVDGQQALSRVMNLLKGGSAKKIKEVCPEIKLDAQTEHFWQKRYGAKVVEPGALKSVRQYIQTQKERPEKYER